MKSYLKKSFSAKEIGNTLITILSVSILFWFTNNINQILDHNMKSILEFIIIFILLLFLCITKTMYINKVDKKKKYIIFNVFILFILLILFCFKFMI
ncbi:hypothetical protein DY102_03745 [Apilactobacillus timberlakei]|nr:hypothetical protein DY102_03745 [Apilactobacillus timberlakei]